MPGTMHFSSGYSLMGMPAGPKCRDMRAAVVGHRNEHRRQPPDVGFLHRAGVVLPHSVDDRGMSGIARGTVIELAAEVDDFHGTPFEENLRSSFPKRSSGKQGHKP